uniref:Major facilitator superfamily (MFS) profile domain-containing protein n=1 Tax=Aegilops tauschii subsp. strangulata TaxID=200361 RepID=A0A453KXI4_AEGTS
MAGGGMAALGVKKERAAEYKGRMTLAVAMACLVAAVGGSIFGYDIGISGKSCSHPHTHLTSAVTPSTHRLVLFRISARRRSAVFPCMVWLLLAMGHRKKEELVLLHEHQ